MSTIIDNSARMRTAQIKLASNGTVICSKISINTNKVLPLTYINDNIGSRQQVADPMVPKQPNTLALFDRVYENNNNGASRFVEFVLPMNINTGSAYSMYYDKQYSDIFIVPDLEMFLLPGTVSEEIPIDGYSVGGIFDGYSQSCFHSSVNKVIRKKLNLIDKPSLSCSGKLMLMTGFGRTNNGRFSHVNVVSSTGGFVQRSLDEYTDVITLPPLVELFSNINDIDAYLYYQNKLSTSSLVKIDTLDSSARLSVILPA